MENGKLIIKDLAAACLRYLARNGCDSGIFNYPLSILNYLKLQMTAAGYEYIAPRQHACLIAGEKCDRAGDIFRIKMLF